MKPLKVNLLDSDASYNHSHPRGRSLATPTAIIAVFLASFGFGRMTMSFSPASLEEFDSIPILRQVRHLIGSPDRKLKGEASDRINILLLGMGGEGHEGPNLTDTIILASIRPSTGQATLLSVPRDLLVPVDGQGWRKVNSANAFGELAAPGRGADATRNILEQVFGIDIPYYVRIDFDGFREVVDNVDGLDVYVDRSFTDPSYPAANFATQTISFKAGWQHFDGAEALKFARSRHGSGGEGNDFARSRRQQKVIAALKEKLLSFETLKNPARVSTVLASLRSHVATNLQIGEILRLAKIGAAMDRSAIAHKVIDIGADSPLTESMLAGAYVLVPKNDDWSGVRQVAADIFDLARAEEAPTPKPEPQRASIEIRNGTETSGLARDVSGRLAELRFDIVKIGNADAATHKKTLIYDFTSGSKGEALERLKLALGAVEARGQRDRLEAASGVDFLVILGQN